MSGSRDNQMDDCNQSRVSRVSGSTTSRFAKYKTMIQDSKVYDDSIKIQLIFSHLTYTPIQLESCLKDTKSATLDRMSTVQSELDSSLQSSNGDAFLLSSNTLQSFTSSNQQLQSRVQAGKPPYLQQFSKLNSITPNFRHPLFNIKQEMKKLASLIRVAIQAINHAYGCALRVMNKEGCIRLFSSEGDQLTLKFFMFSGWEKVKIDPCIEMMRPVQNFRAHLNIGEIVEELELLLCKASRYELAGSLAQEMCEQMYVRIRQNLFEVEERLVACSNTLYSLWNSEQYPSFYYMYLRILREELTGDELEYAIRQFRRLWEMHEPVTCSQIGRAVWSKIHSLNTK